MGDTHDIVVVRYQLDRANIKNSIIVHVGDIGVGFRSIEKEEHVLWQLQKWLVQNNNLFFGCRGNHEDPSIFNLDHRFNKTFSNIKFLPDYSRLNINDKKFLFVGGAISIDRMYRTPNKDYWVDESFVLGEREEDLTPCDVLITHSSGINQFPVGGLAKIAHWLERDDTLERDIILERTNIQNLYDKVKPKIAHIFGHFHHSHTEYDKEVLNKCLNINELYKLNV